MVKARESVDRSTDRASGVDNPGAGRHRPHVTIAAGGRPWPMDRDITREAPRMRPISDLVSKRARLLGAGLAVALLAGGTFAFSASPAAQFPNGSLRLSSAASAASISISGTDGPDSLKRVLRTVVKVPSGKVADVQATFSTSMLHNSGQYAYCFGYFTLDSQSNLDPQFKPGQTQLLGGETATMPNAVGVAMTGFRKNIGSGTHYVNVYISSAYAGCTLMERALNVVVNLR
jgi:hypothetical protein